MCVFVCVLVVGCQMFEHENVLESRTVASGIIIRHITWIFVGGWGCAGAEARIFDYSSANGMMMHEPNGPVC